MAARVGVWAVVALVAITAAVASTAGYELGYRTSPAPSTNSTSGVLSITAAGTLGTLFPAVASALVNESPGVQAPLTSQSYQGSIAALDAIALLHQRFDVAAAADFHLIPSLLEPGYAAYEVAFATTPEVLAYDPSVPALSGMTTANWATKIQSSGVVVGFANASTDPNGYNEIFVLQLQGLLDNGSAAALYGHFFSTPVGSFAQVNPATARLEPETQASTLLSTHVVRGFIIYRSYAVAHHLTYVDFDPKVGLGNLSADARASYARASTTILGPAGPTLLHGAPVIFAATVPTNAANAPAGLAFLHLLISPLGASMIASAGFQPIYPGWVDRPSLLPPVLIPDTVAMPSGLLSART